MTKLGFNIDANNEAPNQYIQLRDARPDTLIMMLNPNEPAKPAPFIDQVPYLVIRIKGNGLGENFMSDTDTIGADAHANSLKAINHYKPFFAFYPKAYWAYYRNEVSDWTKFKLYVDEMIAWLELLSVLGLHGAVGCWGVGSPDYPVWASKDMARLLQAILRYDGILILHEYGLNGDMKGLVNPATNDGDWCLRYRKVWALNGFAAKYPNLKILIGEAGLDYESSTGKGGPYTKIPGLTPAQFAAQLKWYCLEADRDNGGQRPNVVGVASFGWWNDKTQWQPFNVAQIVPQLLDFIKTTRGQIPAPPPPPTPVPPPAGTPLPGTNESDPDVPPGVPPNWYPAGTKIVLRRGNVIKSSNQRVAPDGTSKTAILGVVDSGQFIFVTPAINGYYQIWGQECFLWIQGVQLL